MFLDSPHSHCCFQCLAVPRWSRTEHVSFRFRSTLQKYTAVIIIFSNYSRLYWLQLHISPILSLAAVLAMNWGRTEAIVKMCINRTLLEPCRNTGKPIRHTAISPDIWSGRPWRCPFPQRIHKALHAVQHAPFRQLESDSTDRRPSFPLLRLCNMPTTSRRPSRRGVYDRTVQPKSAHKHICPSAPFICLGFKTTVT